MVLHSICPVYNEQSKVLVLGSFPSVKSRESGFFYGHPQNRFWKVLSGVFKEDVPVTIEEKKHMLLLHQIAVWDVIHSCDIVGSSDSSIKNVEVNHIGMILEQAQIKRIVTNGKKASSLYRKYLKAETKIEDICLPSTSPANAAWNLERLIEAWKDSLLG